MNTPLRLCSSRWLTAVLIAFGGLLASASAWADPPGRVGRIADTEGTAWLWDDQQAEWVQAQRNWPVTQGDRLSVERGSRTSVQIGSATLRLDGGTDVEFTQLDDERVQVRLHGGTVALRARGGDSAREFAVLTNEGRFEPLRAGRYRVDVRDNDGSFGAALQGALRFESRDSLLDLQAGQRAEFWSERGVTHYAWAQMVDDRFADWVAREDREDDRERNRYVSPEMTGAEDLDRYGRWDRHPEYGVVWYPTTVSVGWAPYRYGHWAYIGPWGWTWVDDAPWGFAPFHYGRWVNWHGRWGWVPGQYVARPVYAPALVAWFGGPNVSISIGIGSGVVGWVPLAPREVYYPTYSVTNIYVRNVNSPYRHWQGPDVRYEPRPPSRPISYTNQGVAGGVTLVPQGVMRERRPVANAVVTIDPSTVKSWSSTPQATSRVPVEPPARAAAADRPNVTAVPAAPGAVRAAPWLPPGRSTRGSDGGEDRGRAARPQARDDNVPRTPPASRVEPRAPGAARPDIVPVPTQRPAVVPPPRRDDNERAGPRGNGGRDEDRRGRGASPPPVQQPAPPGAPAVQPAPPSTVGRAPQAATPQAMPPQGSPKQGQRGRSGDDAAQSADRPGRGNDVRDERGGGRNEAREQQNR